MTLSARNRREQAAYTLIEVVHSWQLLTDTHAVT